MKTIDKAIWYIENHYREQISLERLAKVAGVSRYHLSRIFCYAVGQPVSRYVRLRRLSNAAIALAAGEPDILDLALTLGYGSHEAFSRAFKQLFGQTPEQVRRQGHTRNLDLTEAFQMEQGKATELPEPQTIHLGKTQIAGLARHYPFDKVAGIPDQWQSFAPLLGRISTDVKPVTYGVIFNGADDSFDYLSGVELSPGREPPANMVQLTLAPQTYLVFEHPGHVATLRETCNAIWSDWLPASGRTAVEAPWFERYGERFDPQTGAGGLQIWIPVATS